jgi:hypothetical protein
VSLCVFVRPSPHDCDVEKRVAIDDLAVSDARIWWPGSHHDSPCRHLADGVTVRSRTRSNVQTVPTHCVVNKSQMTPSASHWHPLTGALRYTRGVAFTPDDLQARR